MSDLIVLLWVEGFLPARPTSMMVNNWFIALKAERIREQISVKISWAKERILRFVFVIDVMSSIM